MKIKYAISTEKFYLERYLDFKLKSLGIDGFVSIGNDEIQVRIKNPNFVRENKTILHEALGITQFSFSFSKGTTKEQMANLFGVSNGMLLYSLFDTMPEDDYDIMEIKFSSKEVYHFFEKDFGFGPCDVVKERYYECRDGDVGRYIILVDEKPEQEVIPDLNFNDTDHVCFEYLGEVKILEPSDYQEPVLCLDELSLNTDAYLFTQEGEVEHRCDIFMLLLRNNHTLKENLENIRNMQNQVFSVPRFFNNKRRRESETKKLEQTDLALSDEEELSDHEYPENMTMFLEEWVKTPPASVEEFDYAFVLDGVPVLNLIAKILDIAYNDYSIIDSNIYLFQK